MEATKLQLEEVSAQEPEPEPEPEPESERGRERTCSGESLMPGLGALLELATTPRERPPDTEADTDIGKWLASIGAPESAEDIFLEEEIDTLGELTDTVSTREDLNKYLTPEFADAGWETILRIKSQKPT